MSAPTPEPAAMEARAEETLRAAALEIIAANANHIYLNACDTEAFKSAAATWTGAEKVWFIEEQVPRIARYDAERHKHSWSFADTPGWFTILSEEEVREAEKEVASQREAEAAEELESEVEHLRYWFIKGFLRGRLAVDDAAATRVLTAFLAHSNASGAVAARDWPVAAVLARTEKTIDDAPVSAGLRELLEKLLATAKTEGGIFRYPSPKELRTLTGRIENLLARGGSKDAEKPTVFNSGDAFAPLANAYLESLPRPQQKAWSALLTHAARANGSKPSEKFLKEGGALVATVGEEEALCVLESWMAQVTAMPLSDEWRPYVPGSSDFGWTARILLQPANAERLKGLVWLTALYPHTGLLNAIAALAARCFKKIPNQGPTNALVGNACLFALFRAGTAEALGHLSSLRARIVHPSTEKLLDRYTAEAAAAHGLTPDDLEDRSLPTHSLNADGQRSWEVDGYRAVLSIGNAGAAAVQWYAPGGKPQKSAPTTTLKAHPEVAKTIKETLKAVSAASATLRERIDTAMRSGRRIGLADFEAYWLRHPIAGPVATRLIWTLYRAEEIVGNAVPSIDGWRDSVGLPVAVDGVTHVSLLHPVLAPVAEVEAWRAYVMEHAIRQPVKQAYREVYLLTDAERATRTYSNRMAAHLLKQHQFDKLAKTRGWRYTLTGGFDSGGGTATKLLPEAGLRAEFWTEEVASTEEQSASGIWLYVSTDQVRFTDPQTGEAVPLENVPARTFSEAMRDVDLFVGVASVGADPAWRDGGERRTAQQINYWQDYSFGELGEVAKTRRDILQRLLPRIKIREVAWLEDRFLVVKGKLRTYKIHLGSTNILMEPNDQYLCIVPDRSNAAKPIEQVFLPFEGDNGLSVILSKAFLLADDDKITDSSITSQILHR